MTKKFRRKPETIQFEVEGIEEANAPSPPPLPRKNTEPIKIELEHYPEHEGEEAPTPLEAKVWILERRAAGLIADVRRWLFGKAKR